MCIRDREKTVSGRIQEKHSAIQELSETNVNQLRGNANQLW